MSGPCEACQALPATHAESFLAAGGAEVPRAFRHLDGWAGQDLTSGLRTFEVRCPRCDSAWAVEVDVEPFVWDLTLRRREAP